MNSARTKKFMGIDSPKVILPIIGLLAVASFAKIFGILGTGLLTGMCLGIITSFVIRYVPEVKRNA